MIKRMSIIFSVIFIAIFLAACNGTSTETTTAVNNTTSLTTPTTIEDTTTSSPETSSLTTSTTITEKNEILLHTSSAWEDTDYVYSLSRGTNKLSEINYIKGDSYESAITLDISNIDLEDFTKLVLRVKGNYNLKVTLHSLNPNEESIVEYGIVVLIDEYQTFELDISGSEYEDFRRGLQKISITIAPFANNVFGLFYIDYLAFENGNLLTTPINYSSLEPEINYYDGIQSIFDINSNWYNEDYVYSIVEEDGEFNINYGKLSGQENSSIKTKISGEFSNFDYINFTFIGLEGRSVLFLVDPVVKLAGDQTIVTTVEMTGEIQNVTVFLDQLSNQAKNSIEMIEIILEPNNISSITGSFTISKAEFSNIALADKVEGTSNDYLGGGDSFDFNHYWRGYNGLDATITELDQDAIRVDYLKTAQEGLVYTEVSGHFSDFDYINIAIQASPNQEFLISFNTSWSYRADQHLRTDELGILNITMTLKLLFFDVDKDAIDIIRIQPLPNESDITSSFTITKAEFSNTPLVNHVPKTEIGFDDWMQIGDVFELNSTNNTISWESVEGIHRLTARLNGDYTISASAFLYPTLEVTIISSVNMTISFQVDGAIYNVDITPNQTIYTINLASPSSGVASYWKFSSGFNLWLDIDTSNEGSFILTSVQFK